MRPVEVNTSNNMCSKPRSRQTIGCKRHWMGNLIMLLKLDAHVVDLA